MFHKLHDFITADREYFSTFHGKIAGRNKKMLKNGSIVYGLVLFFYTALTYATGQPDILRVMYLVFDTLHLFFCLVLFSKWDTLKGNLRRTQGFCIWLELSILSFFVLEGVFTDPDQQSLYIPIAILLVLLLYIHTAIYAYVVTAIYGFAFIVLVLLYKTPEAYRGDIQIALATVLSALIGYFLIAEMRHSEANALLQYEKLSRTDQLSGLYNKASIQDICERLLSEERKFAFLIVDLDGFKQVNDLYGHDVGDEVLRAVSDALRMNFRASDYVGRFGGDEFIVMMNNCSDLQIIRSRAESLIQRVSDLTFSVEGLKTQCSIGIALKAEEDTTQSIFKRADTMLYQAKSHGKGGYFIAS